MTRLNFVCDSIGVLGEPCELPIAYSFQKIFKRNFKKHLRILAALLFFGDTISSNLKKAPRVVPLGLPSQELLTEFAEKTLKEGKVIPGTLAI